MVPLDGTTGLNLAGRPGPTDVLGTVGFGTVGFEIVGFEIVGFGTVGFDPILD